MASQDKSYDDGFKEGFSYGAVVVIFGEVFVTCFTITLWWLVH